MPPRAKPLVMPRGTPRCGWKNKSPSGPSAACCRHRRFFGVADNETLEALLTKSASNQQEVTDQLGYQVRRAVEVLIQSLDRADQDHGRELLAGVSPKTCFTNRP